MTIAGAIDAINDKIAGSDQPAATTIEGALNLLLDNVGNGGGGSLPVASADTLGGVKVGSGLSITEQGVLSASGGGGGGLFIVNGEREFQDVTIEKSYAQIVEAFNNGSIPILKIDVTMMGDSSGYEIYQFCQFNTIDNELLFNFGNAYIDSDVAYIEGATIVITQSGTITYTLASIAES